MSDGYNKPQYHAIRQSSSHDPAIGDVFEWHGIMLRCADGGECSGCFFNEDFRKTEEHRNEMAQGCVTHFCESVTRSDGRNVKFVKERA